MSSRPLPDHRPPAKPFHCALCNKSYARIHEFEAHENSYDHQHKKRFQEMKAMQRPTAKRTVEESDSVVRKIAVAEKPAGGGGGGFKKAGFKSAFGAAKVEVPKEPGEKEVKREEQEEESTDDETGYEVYDPARPTD